MLLSIIIPVYNAGKMIGKCLDSIRHLEEEDIEVIVINDGSTDDTAKYLECCCDKDNRLRLYEKENSGVSDTRNYGVSLCQGKYITFVDADDEISEEYNQLISMLKKTDYDLYSFDFKLCIAGNENVVEKKYLQEGVNNKEIFVREIFAGRSNNVWNHIYKTQIIRCEKIFFEKEVKMGEDLLFNLKYLQFVKCGYYINQTLYRYNGDNTGSAVHNKKLSYLDDYIKIYNELIKMKNKYPENEIDKGNYLLQVYEVLKYHGRAMKKEQEKRLRNSNLFRDIMTASFFGQWNLIIKQILMKFYLYKIWIP